MAAAVGDSLDLSGRGYLQDPSAPDPIRPHAGDNLAPGRDDFDDLFADDPQIDEPFRDTNDNGARLGRAGNDDEDRGLGIDEEVKVRKPRAKQAKLDETRLLSAKGIPELRKITKTRLKFRGKGHEFSDVSRMLNMYQLWLDDLFPKAKFADGLSIIEKVGHSRRMQIMRREWIDEEKRPKETSPTRLDEQGTEDVEMSGALNGVPDNERQPEQDSLFVIEDAPSGAGTNSGVNSASASVQRLNDATVSSNDVSSAHDGGTALFPEEDDLDALLAEDEASRQPRQPRQQSASHNAPDDFEDDMDAMRELDMM